MGFETSGRKQVERRARSLRRGWLRRRDLRARDLSAAAADLLAEWSEARARLELGDERGEWGDRWQIAAQNSVARLAGRLKELVVSAGPSPEEEMRTLLAQSQWEPSTPEDEPEPSLDDALFEAFEDDSPSVDEILSASADAPTPAVIEPTSWRQRSTEPVSPYAWFSEKSRRGVGGLPREF